MLLSIENMPYISLGWIGLGFFVLIVGIFLLASLQAAGKEYTDYDDGKELFSFFLQEEEKKNEAFRESIKKEYEQLPKEPEPLSLGKVKNKQVDEDLYTHIIQLYEKKVSIDEIAKQMKVGVGEVKLIISLYSMR